MKKLPSITHNFSAWYNDVITEAELVDESPTKGTTVIRPYGYALWENIQKILDANIKKLGVRNAYFPLLIPEEFISKEKKHVQGFSPELAVVTYAGGKELSEKLVIRPTSETIIYHMFARWIHSWRDLPYKINQWANVVRWEMRTRPFLRTSEFLWQEGHTAHESYEDAHEFITQIMALYKNLMENYLAIPVVTGEKSAGERFAGAQHTFTFEAMMQDGKALQLGTTHILDQSFPKAFGISYQDKHGNCQVPVCTSWAVTTRLIGAIIMIHGDEKGLILPPRIAPTTVVIIPIIKTDSEKIDILATAKCIKRDIEASDYTVIIDDTDSLSVGAKFYKWELKGVPIRIELGMRDIEKQTCVIAGRIATDNYQQKTSIPLKNVASHIDSLSEELQSTLFKRARNYLNTKWHQAEKISSFGPDMAEHAGFYQAGWCGGSRCEEDLKAYKATIRCLLDDFQHEFCFSCEKKSIRDVIVAKAY